MAYADGCVRSARTLTQNEGEERSAARSRAQSPVLLSRQLRRACHSALDRGGEIRPLTPTSEST